ncbi:MAG: transposase zinc-binding domain-containing protein [Burkholderiaceae bacterium]|nr:transposase zinc-binding domain-containing protein [Burkholderiaceae bacterium]
MRRPPARFLTPASRLALRTPPTGADHAVPPGPAACGQLHRPHRGQHGRRVAAVHQGQGSTRFLECGILAHGFLRLRCGECGHDKLLAFSCKRRGFCPSCGARRMSQTAAHLVDHVIPHVPVRSEVNSIRRALAAARAESAALKRRVSELERSLRQSARIAHARPPSPSPSPSPVEEADGADKFRFRASGMASNRKRLGLSAADFGLLVSASGQSVYAWEQGKARPRGKNLAAIAALRGVGKREVVERLAALKSGGPS